MNRTKEEGHPWPEESQTTAYNRPKLTCAKPHDQLLANPLGEILGTGSKKSARRKILKAFKATEGMNMSDENDENAVEQLCCKACKKNEPDPAFAFPLCPRCRYLLVNRPYPIWIKIVMVVVACLILYSAFKFPIALKAGVAQKAGKHAEAQQDYSSAILEYQKILALFPQSQEHKARLAVCFIKSGEIQQAADIINTVDEKLLSKDVVAELYTLIGQLKQEDNE